jgi:soluble cytochrome b562
MHTFYSELGELKDVVASEDRFKDPKNKQKILAALARLNKKLNARKPKRLDSTPGFSVTYDMLASHVEETEKIFVAGELDYARLKLTSMTNYCTGCHARLPKMKKGFTSETKSQFSLPKTPKVSDVDFLFVGRQYKLALEGYNKLIRESKKGELESQDYEHVFWQKLVLFARIWRDADQAINSFAQDLKTENLPPGMAKRVQGWLAQFKAWDQSQDLNAMSDSAAVKASETEIAKIASKKTSAMAEPVMISLLRYSGVLYELLFETEQSDLHPRILRGLATAEGLLAKPLQWISLQDVYLKRCVTLFPKSKSAPLCLEDYKAMMDEKFPVRKPQFVTATIASLENTLNEAKTGKKNY